mmetsp:Transcript_17519/g.33243  ORF Transcript_17519/g.33243 Transcript_17519/m.33243 type:complete len:84 (+) Transcript_17519:55-306(+)
MPRGEAQLEAAVVVLPTVEFKKLCGSEGCVMQCRHHHGLITVNHDQLGTAFVTLRCSHCCGCCSDLANGDASSESVVPSFSTS